MNIFKTNNCLYKLFAIHLLPQNDMELYCFVLNTLYAL